MGDAKMGVYAFYDYDGELIYVGRTAERLRTRVRRHLTNQRTDAVAMNVLDPFEVAEVEMWPFWDLEREAPSHANVTLESAESTVYEMLLKQSVFSAVLNEVPVTHAPSIPLPESTRQRIIPDDVYDRRLHPDIRIARRANTIARLAQIISERCGTQVLVTQAAFGGCFHFCGSGQKNYLTYTVLMSLLQQAKVAWDRASKTYSKVWQELL